MARIGSTFEDVLKHPDRAAIIKSILSREDASTIDEIQTDVNVTRRILYKHLRLLIKREVLARDVHPTKTNMRNNQPDHQTYMYYISPKSESLQGVLQKLFPEGFRD